MTTGNAADFGDCTDTQYMMAGTSSSTRGVTQGAYNGGQTGPCDYLTIASQGNMVNYGDLSVARISMGGTSNSVRAVDMGGQNTGGNAVNTIDYGIIPIGGTWTDFGDLTAIRGAKTACVSDSHGGLCDGYQGTRPPPGGMGRGFCIGGSDSSYSWRTEFLQIPTTGNATDFGEMTTDNQNNTGAGNNIRSVSVGGQNPSGINNIVSSFINASTGNASDFGDQSVTRIHTSTCGNTTRFVSAQGLTPSASDVIDYAAFATTGNMTDFGDMLSNNGLGIIGQCNSPTRGIYAGGGDPIIDVISYITIGSTGNAIDFGNMSSGRQTPGAFSSDVRGCIFGGEDTGSNILNVIDYITIASTGNASDFGDLTTTTYKTSGASTNIRGVRMGGQNPSYNPMDTIDYVTIAATGNAIDFGDLATATKFMGSSADSHGGLQST
jgi:hypothetical protein